VTQSDYVKEKMEEALHHLHTDGCRRVHIIGHSMGARVVAACADMLQKLFPQSPDAKAERRTAPEPAKYGPGVMELASVSFFSPDIDFGEFVGHAGLIFRAICPIVTIYGDANDSSLFWASFINTRFFKLQPQHAPPGLKEEWCDLVSRHDVALRRLCGCTRMHERTPRAAANALTCMSTHRAAARALTCMSAHRAAASGIAGIHMHECTWCCSERRRIPLGTSLGRHCSTIIKDDGGVLDVDFVATAFLTSNIHSQRHNYFHLNRCVLAGVSTPAFL
jgi:Alpha/beta hydrolase of unknown function (DUF900)